MANYDTRRSLVAFSQDITLVAVIEMSQSSWLVGGVVPGAARDPEKKLVPEPEGLLALLGRWQSEAVQAGHTVERVVVGYESGRDGFWLARWLQARGVEAHVMHATSVTVPRTHRRPKSDRVDLRTLRRALLGWLRGERDHCTMAPIPTLQEEDARRPNRERQALTGEQTRLINSLKSTLARFGIRDVNPVSRRAAQQLAELRTPEGTALPANTLAEMRRQLARLDLVREQLAGLEQVAAARLEETAVDGRPTPFQMLHQVVSIGPATADLLDAEVMTRRFDGAQAVARYGALTGAPDESGRRCREQGLARAGNLRVRHTMIQMAWRFLRHQPDSALTRWYRERVETTPGDRRLVRKKLIVALARKLLVALWRMVTTGEIPEGVALKPAATARPAITA